MSIIYFRYILCIYNRVLYKLFTCKYGRYFYWTATEIVENSFSISRDFKPYVEMYHLKIFINIKIKCISYC